MSKENGRAEVKDRSPSLDNITTPDEGSFLRFVELGKEASKKSEKKFESVRHVSEEDMSLLLS